MELIELTKEQYQELNKRNNEIFETLDFANYKNIKFIFCTSDGKYWTKKD